MSDPLSDSLSEPAAAPSPLDSQSVGPMPVGQTVQLLQRPPYLKTADPMPMLRPPDLVDPGETGIVVALRPLDHRAVRFRRGTFLLPAAALSPASEPS